jgi:hypothetical protein
MINKFKDWLFENSNDLNFSQKEAVKDFEVFVENFEGQTVEEEWNEYRNTIGEDLDDMYQAIEDKLKDSIDNIYAFDPDLEPLFIADKHSPFSQEMVKKYSLFAGLFAPEGDYKGKKLWGSTADAWLIYADFFDSHILGKVKLPYCVYMEDRGMTRVYISRRDFIHTFGSIEEFLDKKRGILHGKRYGL